jgi:trimeric autotransporter adhesin
MFSNIKNIYMPNNKFANVNCGGITIHNPTGKNIYSFPNKDGTNNQILKTDGNGNLLWADDKYNNIIRKDDANNLFAGTNAGELSTGNNNIGIGLNALYNNYEGGDLNIGIGSNTLKSNSTGDKNVSIGDSSLFSNKSGDYNLSLGSNSLYYNKTGSHNIGLGYKSLYSNISGQNNIAIGNNSGQIINNGNNNIIIGYNADPSNDSASNQIVIGKGATGLFDNSVTLGNADVTSVYMGQDSGATVFCAGLYNTTGDGLQLKTNHGTSEKINIINQQGSSNDSINIESISGGVNIASNYGGIILKSTDTTNGIKIGTENSGIPITIGKSTSILPADDNGVNLGSSNYSFSDAHIQGVIYASKINNGVQLTLPTADGSANQVLKTNGGGILSFATISGGASSSDRRIKTNIVDVPDDLALQQVRDIQCFYYEYIDKATKGIEKTIGFIAQEVKEVLPMAITEATEFIPDEYRILENITWEEIVDVSGNSTYKMSSDLTNVNGINYKFIVSTNLSDNLIEKEIIGNSDDTFTFDVSYQYVFCYGKKVDDFHTVDKDIIFTLHHSAIQKIDKLQLEEKDKVTALETKVSELETKLDNIMTILSNNNLT